MTDEEVYGIFEESGALWRGHFLLTSGRHSDRYMQCARLFVNPRHGEALARALAEKLADMAIDKVAVPAIGGIITGYAVARHLGADSVFAERNADGQMEFRRGFTIAAGERVLVAEDVVTTGGSVREVVRLVREAGGTVAGIASIVDRSGGAVSFDCPYRALLSVNIASYGADECPICKTGLPLVKPGSRK
jgi:orotate phosphoribosyltransferase